MKVKFDSKNCVIIPKRYCRLRRGEILREFDLLAGNRFWRETLLAGWKVGQIKLKPNRKPWVYIREISK